MRIGWFHWATGLGLAMVVGVIVAACGSDDSTFPRQGSDGGGDAPSGQIDGSIVHLPDSGSGTGDSGGLLSGTLTISPANQTLDVTVGSAAPTLHYVAHVGTATVPVSWSIDRGEIGSIGTATGDFIAGETVGGTAHVTATYGKETATTKVTLFLHFIENGGPAVADAGVDSAADAGADAAADGGVCSRGRGDERRGQRRRGGQRAGRSGEHVDSESAARYADGGLDHRLALPL
jgi:hypothetical protein